MDSAVDSQRDSWWASPDAINLLLDRCGNRRSPSPIDITIGVTVSAHMELGRE
jgi:hypothetical protein